MLQFLSFGKLNQFQTKTYAKFNKAILIVVFLKFLVNNGCYYFNFKKIQKAVNNTVLLFHLIFYIFILS